jgi:hypothetical protein
MTRDSPVIMHGAYPKPSSDANYLRDTTLMIEM